MSSNSARVIFLVIPDDISKILLLSDNRTLIDEETLVI
jgi:hypothetical protein